VTKHPHSGQIRQWFVAPLVVVYVDTMAHLGVVQVLEGQLTECWHRPQLHQNQPRQQQYLFSGEVLLC
jgi:hypothetical protein